MKLKSKKNVGKRKVYDMSVCDNHNFVANGIVVHNCVNYKVANYIKENLHDDRLLIHDSETREQVLQQHITGDSPTVLLSPSMTEGVDLADDASRFQVLCKTPFPYLGDSVVKRRMARDPEWYAFQTIKTIIQALGRSIRNENDFAVSYILDSDWQRLYKQNRHLFPRDFSQLLV